MGYRTTMILGGIALLFASGALIALIPQFLSAQTAGLGIIFELALIFAGITAIVVGVRGD